MGEFLGRVCGALIVAVLVFGVVYLIGAFAVWDWNPGRWEISVRAPVGMVGMFLATVGFGIVMGPERP